MVKSADAFRTIREVSDILNTPAHVLRFWETKFSQIKPVKRAGGRRYYRRSDINLIAGIKKLLHADGVTIRGVQKVLREQGVKHVAEILVAPYSELSALGPSSEIASGASEGSAQPEDTKPSPSNPQTRVARAEAPKATAKENRPEASTDLPSEEPLAKVKKAGTISAQISLFDDLPLSGNPSTKPANKQKTLPELETTGPSHPGEDDQTDLRTDDDIVPEIAAQLAQHTAAVPDDAQPNSIDRVPKEPAPGGGITTATAISGPLHYLSQVDYLRPLQQEQLPKLRDMLSEIFHGEE
jgi:DNA-binding transcriptional MerR regulator